MDAERWRNIEAFFHDALERPAGERPAFLESACDDPTLRREVIELLAAEESAEARLEGAVTEALELAADDGVPEAIGPYRVKEHLGEGGLATVYLAARAEPRLEVAIKIVKRGMDTVEILRRLRLERQILASLDHPNIARLLDGGSLPDGRPYVVMEYIDGAPLDVHCDQNRLDVRERLELFLEICSAVHAAHRSLVIHRDLKPSNILVTRAGEPKLLDFGIAKLLDPDRSDTTIARTMTGMRWLTPEYASPEQVRGEPLTTAADVYALGVLLYELLCGRRPFEFTTGRPREIERLVSETEPTRPSARLVAEDEGDEALVEAIAAARRETPERLAKRLAGDLDVIVGTALRKEPDRRYSSAEALAEDVRRHLDSRPVLARPDTALYRLGKFVRRHRTGVAAAALVLVSLVGGMVATTRALVVANAERERAERHLAELEEVVDFNVEMFEIVDPGEARGNTITVREVLDRAAGRVDDELGHRPAVAARLLSTLGLVHRALGLYDPAADLLERSLERRREAFDEASPEVARGLHELAEARLDQRRFEESEALFEEALALRRDLFGERHAEVATSLHGLATVELSLERYEKAEALFREALALRRQVLGEDHPETAESWNDLGETLYYLERFDEAEEHFRRALDLRREHFGTIHPLVAETLNNLATTAQEEGMPEAAEALHREILEIRRRLYDGPHRDVLRTLNNLANAVQEQDRLDEAEALLREALEMAEATLGDDPVDLARQLRMLAVNLLQQERYEEALPLLERSWNLRRESLGAEHPATLFSSFSLAQTLGRLGRHREAAERLERQVRVQRRLVDDFAPAELAHPLTLLAEQYAFLDRCDLSAPAIEEALALRANLPADDELRLRSETIRALCP